MSTELIRGIELFYFPYDKIKPGEEVILYGFGDVGRQYYWQIIETGYCKIKYVVDKKYNNSSFAGLPVKSPECLKDDDETRIVVGVRDKTDEVVRSLIDMGVDRQRIVSVDHSIEYPISSRKMRSSINILRYTFDEIKNERGSEYLKYLDEIRSSLRIYGINATFKFDYDRKHFVRIGRNNDGGYIMANCLSNSRSKIAYSFGIADDVSWDKDMADRGFDIFMFDHTIDALPFSNDRFHFVKKGIADSSEYDRKQFGDLAEILKENGHNTIDDMILKMDVEGAEYGFINSTGSNYLALFDQIVLEFHNLLSAKGCNERLDALKKIITTHLPIHVHANNMGDVLYLDDLVFADCLEVTFINKNKYSGFLDKMESTDLPIADDMPCWREVDEIRLGNWNLSVF